MTSETSSGHIFQGQKGSTVEFANFKELNNIRMLQPSQRLGFETKPLLKFFVFEYSRCHDLECHGPMQLAMARAIDHAHAAATDLIQDLVFTDNIGQRAE